MKLHILYFYLLYVPCMYMYVCTDKTLFIVYHVLYPCPYCNSHTNTTSISGYSYLLLLLLLQQFIKFTFVSSNVGFCLYEWCCREKEALSAKLNELNAELLTVSVQRDELEKCNLETRLQVQKYFYVLFALLV